MHLRHLLLLFLSFISINIFSQTTASQQVTIFTIEAPQLNTEKKIWVYLPKNYKNSEKAYSVIYMHDAQNLFDMHSSYAGEWKIDEYLDTLSKNESIIIGIEHGNEKRIEELTPYVHEKYGGGKGDLYLDFIISTLKPKIDSTYRTLTDAKHTTIFGSSLGGLLSFYAAIKHPEIFGNTGVFSPSFWYSDKIYDLVSNAELSSTSKFYFMVGTDEDETMVSNQKKMVTLLKHKGVKNKNIKNIIIEGGQHNEGLWSNNFPAAYQWLFNK